VGRNNGTAKHAKHAKHTALIHLRVRSNGDVSLSTGSEMLRTADAATIRHQAHVEEAERIAKG
jgi:hypothetical protein